MVRNSIFQFFLVFISIGFTSVTLAKSWIPLTDSTNKHCESKCIIVNSEKQLKHSVTFEVEEEEYLGEKQFIINAVNIQTSKEKVRTYKMPELDSVHIESQLELYAVDINNDGFLDLALAGERTATEGMLYYYFVYNPEKKEFVFSDEPLPKLSSRDPFKNKIKGKAYVLGKDYSIKRAVSSTLKKSPKKP